MRFQYADETVKHLSFDNGTGQDCPAGEPGYVIYKTVTSKVPWRITLSNQSGSSVFFYDKCGIFEGDISLEDFERYRGEVFEKGQPIPGLSGINTLFADTGALTVSGRADLVTALEQLKTVALSVNEEV